MSGADTNVIVWCGELKRLNWKQQQHDYHKKRRKAGETEML